MLTTAARRLMTTFDTAGGASVSVASLPLASRSVLPLSVIAPIVRLPEEASANAIV